MAGEEFIDFSSSSATGVVQPSGCPIGGGVVQHSADAVSRRSRLHLNRGEEYRSVERIDADDDRSIPTMRERASKWTGDLNQGISGSMIQLTRRRESQRVVKCSVMAVFEVQ